MNIAYLFPGQGAQYVGMGKDFFESFLLAKQTFEEADEILKRKISSLIFDGPEAELVKTHHSQVAIFVCSLAILRVLQDQFPNFFPSVCAGLSLGEYTALVAANRIDFGQALLIVQKRAEFMSKSCEKTKGTMAAVLGLSGDVVESIVKGLNPPHAIWAANFNCPGQVVISGTQEGVDAATQELKEKGAKRVIPLQVHGAFHTGLMNDAKEQLTPFIHMTNLKESSIGLVMNVTGQWVDDCEVVKKNLIDQVTDSVRWEQGIRSIMQKGMDLYLEIGCGKTLMGMNKKIGVEQPTLSIEKVADLDELSKY